MGSLNKSFSNELFFPILQTDDQVLQDILHKRLPRSAQLYNMSLMLHAFPHEMKSFCLDGNLTSDAIIMIIFMREDYGQDISISVPDDLQVSRRIRDTFATSLIDWTGLHLFTATDRLISKTIFEISTFLYRNSVGFDPNYSYVMDIEDALKLEIKEIPGVEIRPLNESSGVKFTLDNWKHSKMGADAYFQKVIRKNITAGAYLASTWEPVCAVVTQMHGLAGALNTNKKYRKRGYAFESMKYILKEMANKGLVPASTTQQENMPSMSLHKKLGMKITHESDYIWHLPI